MTRKIQAGAVRVVPATPADAEVFSRFGAETRTLEDPKIARPLIRRGPYKPRTKPNKHLEDDFAMAVNVLFSRILPPEVWWHHNPNGGRRDACEAKRLKDMGVKAGVLDYTLYWVAGDGLREVAHLELKIGKNNTSDEQDAFIARVSKLGHLTGVARNIQEVVGLLISWNCPHRRVS